MKRSRYIILVIITIIFLSTHSASFANEMQDSQVILQIDPLKKTDPLLQISPLISPTSTPTRIHISTSLQGTKDFMLSLGLEMIEFGEITPTNPIIRSQTISLRNATKSTYTLFTEENHPLTSTNTSIIPDTSCDNGTCTEMTAAIWNGTLSFGYGYRCENSSGHDCEMSFRPGDWFKQFPSLLNQKQEQPVMHGDPNDVSKEATITYKVNIATSQPQGSYTNIVTYLLVPGY